MKQTFLYFLHFFFSHPNSNRKLNYVMNKWRDFFSCIDLK